MSDLVRLERELVTEILHERVYIDMDRTVIFEYREDLSSGFMQELDEFALRVDQTPITESEANRFLKKLENSEEIY